MTKGQRIRSLRETLMISQTDLAEKIQVSKQTLYKYENDIVTNIPSDKIEALAVELNTTPSYLMGWPGDEEAISFYAQYLSLSPEKQSAFLSYLKFLKSET